MALREQSPVLKLARSPRTNGAGACQTTQNKKLAARKLYGGLSARYDDGGSGLR